MERPKSVREAWRSFEAEVMPPDVPAIQTQEMRRAFYAGAWAMLNMAAGIGDESVGEAEGIATLMAFRGELEAFMAQVVVVGRGRRA